MAYTSREEWLMEAAEFFRPQFQEFEMPLPSTFRISVGYAKRQKKGAIGVCYNSASAEDGVHQIFISPEIKEPVKVLATTMHELIHAADDGVSGHRGEFKRVALALGLTGKMTATVPGEALTASLTLYADKLGPFPHGVLTPARSGPIGRDGTRMLKLSAECCGYVARTSRKWIDYGLPSCPCGNEMILEIK